jgi:hypothetical protein
MTAAHYKGGHYPGNDLGLHYTALPPIVASCPYSDQLLVTRKFSSPGANRPSQAKLCAGVAASALLILISGGGTAFAQKPGGILKMYSLDSPPSLSMLDGANPIGQRTTMGVFNNLVMFDQHVK